MKISYQRLSLMQKILISAVVLIILSLGIYHYTHNGKGSGSIELACVIFLTLSLLLPQSAEKSYHRLSVIQIVFIGVVDFFALLFGIYHLTTPDGLRSGISELTIFVMLTLAIFVPTGSPAI